MANEASLSAPLPVRPELLGQPGGGAPPSREGRYTLADYADLPLEAVAYLPLQRISLLDLTRIVSGTIFYSTFHSADDLFLRIGDKFMASVSLEPAGVNRGIRINNFDARAQVYPTTGAAKLAPLEEDGLSVEARNLRSCTVPLALCFGSRPLLLKDALQLSPGQLFNMNAPLHGPVSLLVHNRVIAYGTPMLHSNCYSVVVTELAKPSTSGSAH
jgi:flagellar motor switch/type III secretory pathway protein FliN